MGKNNNQKKNSSKNSTAKKEGKTTGADKTLDNEVQRLSYYLYTLQECLQSNLFQKYVTDWKSAGLLRQDQEDNIITAALRFSPDQLLGKMFFDADNSKHQLIDKQFKFIDLSKAIGSVSDRIERKLDVAGIGELPIQRVVVFKLIWLHKYYTFPMFILQERIQQMVISISRHCQHCRGDFAPCSCQAGCAPKHGSSCLNFDDPSVRPKFSQFLQKTSQADADSPQICNVCEDTLSDCECDLGSGQRPQKKFDDLPKCNVCYSREDMINHVSCETCDKTFCEGCFVMVQNQHVRCRLARVQAIRRVDRPMNSGADRASVRPGQQSVLCELKSREYNGLIVRIVSEEEDGRVAVMLADGRKIRVKHENLARV